MADRLLVVLSLQPSCCSGAESLLSVHPEFKSAIHRCINKAGGLDRYLLKTPDQELASDTGSKLKNEIFAKRQLRKSTQQNLLPFAASAQPLSSDGL